VKGQIRIVNTRTGETIADAAELADTRATRKRGLLGRDSLEPGSALVISPCLAVHTAFMRFVIDVVFVDRNGSVVKIARDLTPWRMAAAWRAQHVIELPAGESSARDVRVGDRLYLATAEADSRLGSLSSPAAVS
jgi:uncharacterized membrane protein (UPF0127 family)